MTFPPFSRTQIALGKRRLRSVVRILREKGDVSTFSMSFMSRLGLPLCPLAYYIAFSRSRVGWRLRTLEVTATFIDSRFNILDHDSVPVQRHFAISRPDAVQLFGDDGCGGATTPDEAAKYIELFAEEM